MQARSRISFDISGKAETSGSCSRATAGTMISVCTRPAEALRLYAAASDSRQMHHRDRDQYGPAKPVASAAAAVLSRGQNFSATALAADSTRHSGRCHCYQLPFALKSAPVERFPVACSCRGDRSRRRLGVPSQSRLHCTCPTDGKQRQLSLVCLPNHIIQKESWTAPPSAPLQRT